METIIKIMCSQVKMFKFNTIGNDTSSTKPHMYNFA